MTAKLPKTLEAIKDQGALFVVNHSGGKDSQAMYSYIAARVPHDQILVIHAHLEDVEWDGAIEHITDTIDSDVDFIVCEATKTFFDMVDHRGMWPSPKYRQCTSDLKRGPIEREVRRYLKNNPQYGGLVVNCMGLRAEESASRAKRETFTFNKRNSKAGRSWHDWLPIHDFTIAQVFGLIALCGQRAHWAYAKGMSRFSCAFCIMSSMDDLKTAARLLPDLGRRYAAKERELDQTLLMPQAGERRFLDELLGFAPVNSTPVQMELFA